LYDYDLVEHIITVNDWINETALTKFISHHHNDGDNKPTSILINGKGAFHKFITQNGDTFTTPRAQFSVKHGYRYRFRVINAGFLYCPIQISIDNHNLTIIATDGRLVEPVEIQNFIIYAGN
jgi:FtsP/CotA-like multicopper oxidase with cupredoxin domain